MSLLSKERKRCEW